MSENGCLRRGRITYDDRGNRVWEWEIEPGVFSADIDTARVKKLAPENLTATPVAGEPKPAFNPYDTQRIQLRPKGRTLDDMRKLSEQIKRGKPK